MLTVTSAQLIRLRFKARELRHKKKPTYSHLSGDIRSRRRGHGIEFHEARPYTYGDDVRHIDWRISARKSVVHTREFQQDHEQNLFLLVDQSLAMRFATTHQLKSVQAANLAALLGWSSIESRNRIGAMIEGLENYFLKPTLNHKKFCYWLGKLALSTEQLVQQNQPKEANWSESLTRSLQLMTPGTHLILIGDLLYLNSLAMDKLSHASRHHIISAVHIYDKFEQRLPSLSDLSFTDGKENFNFQKIGQRQRDKYDKYLSHQKEQFRKLGGQFLLCATDEQPESLISQFLIV